MPKVEQFCSVSALISFWAAPMVLAEEQPRRGGFCKSPWRVIRRASTCTGACVHGGPTAGTGL